MKAATATLHGAWSALGAFLRGFVGMAVDSDASPGCDHPHPHPGRLDGETGQARTSAASARAALTARATRRPSCC